MKVLMLSPEPPYPLHGGGAFRIASLLHYFARFAEVDLILISESGEPALLPPGLVREQHVILLPHHERHRTARYLRNARRATRGIPPLIDRLAGLAGPIGRAIAGRHYDFGIVEHFWCAPYIAQLQACCAETLLDLHNIESVLHERCSRLGGVLVRAGHRRFAASSRKLEAALLPRYSMVLAASEEDASTVRSIAPGSRVEVYPNSLPWIEVPQLIEQPRIVFPANFEYHPNIDAVRFLVSEIWPEVRRRHPELRLRLVGRGDEFIRHLLPADRGTDSGIETTGPVPDAGAEIAQAQIVVAPLRAGSGTRIKIIEAWAAGRAVIATPVAAEGLAAQNDVNISLAPDATQFVAEISRLLAEPLTRQRLGAAGRRTFEDRYSWQQVWKKFEKDLQLLHRSGLNRYTEII
jgi:polysaccharide biosynthesis protein PslH